MRILNKTHKHIYIYIYIYMYICIKHFEDKYYQKGEGNKRFRLIKILKPVTKILIQVIQTSAILHPVR